MKYSILSFILIGIFLINLASAVTYSQNIPQMTANSTPSPYVAWASTSGNGRQPFMLFDKDPANWWQSTADPDTTPQTIAIDMGSGNGFIATNMTLENTLGAGTANPRNFALEYSTDNSTWVGIYNVTDHPNSIANVTYNFSYNNVSARYYRWKIFTDWGASTVAMYENYLFSLAGIQGVTINSPANNTEILRLTNQTFNVTSSSSVTSLANVTMYIDGVLNETKTISGTNNVSLFYKVLSNVQNYTYNFRSCDTSGGCSNSSTQNIIVSNYTVSYYSYNTTSYETKTETFYINLTLADSVSISSSALIYNGTSYTSTQGSSGNNYSFYATLDIPTISGTSANKSFYWSINFSNGGSLTQNTTNQNISTTIFTICNETYTGKFLGVGFKDESDSSSINASIPTSSFTYYLGAGLVNKSYTYSNSGNSFNYTFCATPNQTLYVAPSISYKQGTTYPQRTWTPSLQTYTNTTTNQTLYLLSSSDGIYVVFQVVNEAEQSIEGATVTLTRTIDSVTETIGSGTTGADGSITFWLNPDLVHTLSVSKTGFSSESVTQAFTQTSYTITLTSTTASELVDIIRGINYTILPRAGTFLANGTSTNFNFTMNSSYWTLTSFSFYLQGNNGTILGSNSSTASQDIISSIVNTSNYTSITMFYSWIINGSNSNNSITWLVYDSTSGTGWSIKNFFEDLENFSDEGIFGLDSTNLAMLIFLFIFITTGIASYKFGISSPAVISGIVFAEVSMFDLGFGLIETPINAVPHFPTIFFGILMVAFIIKEQTS